MRGIGSLLRGHHRRPEGNSRSRNRSVPSMTPAMLVRRAEVRTVAPRRRVGWNGMMGPKVRGIGARILASAAIALVPVSGVSAHGRMRGEEAARIRAREAAELAALERSV